METLALRATSLIVAIAAAAENYRRDAGEFPETVYRNSAPVNGNVYTGARLVKLDLLTRAVAVRNAR
jgi:hypothetical protein